MEVNLRACISGDKDAWDAFVGRYSGVIFAAVGHVFGSKGAMTIGRTADDVVQDVFLRLVKDEYRMLRTYDSDRASMATWLTLVARSTAIDCLRKRRMETSGSDPVELATAAEPSATAEPIPLHLLTARQRLVLRLLFDDDRTVAQAAQMLDVDEQTIRSTKHKALDRLRSHFASQ